MGGKRMYARRGSSNADRFWMRVRPEVGDVCWEWAGGRTRCGYGQFTLPGPTGKHGKVYAHRYSYELHFGPIADGLHVLHRCDNPACVRPDHLFLGTHADNMRDAMAKGRLARVEDGRFRKRR